MGKIKDHFIIIIYFEKKKYLFSLKICCYIYKYQNFSTDYYEILSKYTHSSIIVVIFEATQIGSSCYV
jgi:hypothetical protein